MRSAMILGVALSIALGVALLVGGPGLSQVKAPEDFVIQKGENSPGPVTFSHQKHLTKVDKCTTCHLKTFKMKRGQSGTITLEALQEGKFCGSCHDGKTQIAGTLVFPIDACDKCHPA
jgi:c(7)-type cytochrome triheme protein